MKTAKDLQRDVLAELAWDPTLDAAAIGVAAHDGIVTLSGYVRSYAEKRAAENATKRVAGVQGIADDLEVRLSSSARRDDTDIARAAVSALEWSTLVPAERIRVTVEHGWLTLEGDVDWQYERKAAEKAVASLTGVHGVVNKVTVKPPVAPALVEEKIRNAFKRHAELDADRVRVEVSESKVTLRGRVESWGEYERAEWAAWSAPGVTQVENHLWVETETPSLV